MGSNSLVTRQQRPGLENEGNAEVPESIHFLECPLEAGFKSANKLSC